MLLQTKKWILVSFSLNCSCVTVQITQPCKMHRYILHFLKQGIQSGYAVINKRKSNHYLLKSPFIYFPYFKLFYMHFN